MRFGQNTDHENAKIVKSIREVSKITRIPEMTLSRRLRDWLETGKFFKERKKVYKNEKLTPIKD